jgi:outer membrane usher protein
VRVYRENQLIGRTDKHGFLLLPGLRPYDANLIRIEQADLPLDVPIDGMEVEAVPRFRSGMLLDFAVEHPQGALLEIVLENGEPLPPGALVNAVGKTERFPSGLRGEVYITGLQPTNRLRAEWNNQRCELNVSYSQTSDPLPRLGPLVCVSAAR